MFVIPPWASPLFIILCLKPLKKVFAQNIDIIDTRSICRSNSD